jgi:polyisoprenoid-binding protein YceI
MNHSSHRNHRTALAVLSAVLLGLLPAALGFAQDPAHHLHDDGGARDGDFLRFVLTSVKAGLFSSTVEVRVRDFDVSFALAGDTARDVRVAFDVRDMTTGDGGRDDKMWSFCLDAAHHPRIEVEIPGPVEIGHAREIPARMRIRGRWHPIRLSLSSRRAGDRTIVEGHARVSFSELGIPDPSIWIAHVEDRVDIAFRVHLPAGERHSSASVSPRKRARRPRILISKPASLGS